MVVIGEESLYRMVREGVPAGTDVLVGILAWWPPPAPPMWC